MSNEQRSVDDDLELRESDGQLRVIESQPMSPRGATHTLGNDSAVCSTMVS